MSEHYAATIYDVEQLALTGRKIQRKYDIALMDKAERTPAEDFRLKMYKPVLESNNITSRPDFEYLKSVISDTEQKVAPLKENFEKCSRFYDIYSDFAKTYYEISQGDYISRLVEEGRQNRERNNRSKSVYKNKAVRKNTALYF